jgi:cytochrome P450
LGTDTFLTVAPGGLILNTANADVISQILARGNDFPKAVKIYRLVSIYGENVVSTEGATWRYHRKLTKPAFSEENNRLVWRETLNLSQAMLASWVGTRKSSETVHHVARDTMRLSLEVIGRAGLGQAMAWPKSSEDELESETLKEGHTMSFATALEHISQNVIQVAATLTAFPEWFLSMYPLLAISGY